MTLIKLDSGDYVNTEFISNVYKGLDNKWRFYVVGELTEITEADRDRIVEEMTRPNSVADLIDKLDQVDGHLGTIYGGMMNGY